MQFLPDKYGTYRDILNVLVPGGVVATTYQPRHKNATRDEALWLAKQLHDTMESVGFIDVHIRELPLKPVPAISVVGQRPAAKRAAVSAERLN